VRILLLTQVLPFPADSGPKIKTLNLLRYLADRHDVHLVSFVRSDAEAASAEQLRRWCSTVDVVRIRRSRVRDLAYFVEALVKRRSFLVLRDDSDVMRSYVERLVHQFHIDAVHADQLTMGQFAEHLPVPLRVLDEHNAVWTIVRRVARHERWGLRRIAAELEWRRLKAYEGRLCRDFDRVLTVSDEDLRDLESAAGARIRASIIPIAVDTHELHFMPPRATARHILSLATMFYPPNVEGVDWFAREVYPLIRRETQDAPFTIVGSRPPESIQRLATDQPGIEVTGYVADLDPYLRRSAMLVVPLHSGSGMRVKILEAFARGIPVVSTTIGVEGIEARNGEHLLVADSPEAFAGAVMDVLHDPVAAAARATAARRLVEERYDRVSALRPLDDIYLPATVADRDAASISA
jgi:glycosyltransferase involved in cell wall biosynthesis